MELSQQFLIDMALNVGGYLLAGMLGVVIYSLFNRRKPATASAGEEQVQPAVEKAEPALVTESPARRLEFIKLGGAPEAPKTVARPAVREATMGTETAERRDRADIIRVARTMLKAGATHDKIKRVIPISEAELSLLSMSKS